MTVPRTSRADAALEKLARRVGRHLQAAGLKLTLAESCTGGWIAKAITDVPGSSAWFETGFVTYGNAAKQRLLGVKAATLKRHGAVSETTVLEMARGALGVSGADVAVAVSGIAGPDGGTPEKPVGLVWFAWAHRRGGRVQVKAVSRRFSGDRARVRGQAVAYALRGVASL